MSWLVRRYHSPLPRLPPTYSPMQISCAVSLLRWHDRSFLFASALHMELAPRCLEFTPFTDRQTAGGTAFLLDPATTFCCSFSYLVLSCPLSPATNVQEQTRAMLVVVRLETSARERTCSVILFAQDMSACHVLQQDSEKKSTR